MSPLAETKQQVVDEYKRMVDSDRSSRRKSHHHHHHHHRHHSSSPDCRRVKFGQLLQQTAVSEEDNNYEDQMMSCGHSYSSSRGSNASSAETTLSSSRNSTSSSSSPRLSSFNYTGTSSTTTTTTTTTTDDNNNNNYYFSSSPANHLISCSSPYITTSQSSSPFLKSPWIKLSPLSHPTNHTTSSSSSLYFSRGRKCLIGSLLREEGHVYSLAVNDGMLYTGSESNNIRVWRNFQDAGGFKSGSGLVKAIVSCNKHQQVFTGHQDGKIRIWTPKGKRLGTLPKFGDYIKSSMNPNNYVEVRRHHKVPKIKHFDAVSCMSLNQQFGLLYSASWDKTIKVWRLSDAKCLESLEAHDDAINSIAVGYDGLVFSGSADGTVKVWRRELDGSSVKHFHVKTLLKQEYAVTALGVAADNQGWVLYAGSSDGLVNFWERDDEQDLVYGGVLRGHKLAVLCLATAGSLVFTGSTDKTICVWNREAHGDHSCLAVLSAHTGPVKCLAVEQDQDDDDDDDHNHNNNQQRDWILYSGSLDKSVKIWRLSRHALLHQPITY